ncbi:MAG: GNAT family N-acetyltransferase [Erythrobacter sp.]|nr:GNAT family N-acetyltransferase [Erythrobacter sp.]
MSYRIRRFHAADAQALVELTRIAIQNIGARAYSPAQIAAWFSRHMTAECFRERAIAGDLILVAIGEADKPVAYTLLEPDGHLDQLYCHPDHTRRGLADRLLAEAERYAIARTFPRLYTEASELARLAFTRAGYVMLHRRDFVIEHGEKTVPIHNYAMAKILR